MAVPAANYLIEFRHHGKDRSSGAERAVCAVPAGVQLSEIAEQLADAEARGREAGEAAARAELQALIAAERQACEERIAADRAGWMAEQADRLAESLRAALAELEGRVAGSAARILAPLLDDALRAKAVAELSGAVEALVAGEGTGVVQIAGPEPLLDALRARLSGLPAAIDYVATDAAEVRIALGPTLIETTIEAWASRLREAVA